MNRIRDERIKLKLTQKELAEKVGVSYASIRAYETEKREPKIGTLRKMADFFGVTVGFLQGDIGLDSVSSIIDEIQQNEIGNYQNEKYKLMYDPIFKSKLKKKIQSKYDFSNLSTEGARPFIKTILDIELSEYEQLAKYQPSSNKNAICLSQDAIHDVIDKINKYFENDKSLSKNVRDQIIIALENANDSISDIDTDN